MNYTDKGVVFLYILEFYIYNDIFNKSLVEKFYLEDIYAIINKNLFYNF